MAAPEQWMVTLRRVGGGQTYRSRTVTEDIDRPERFRQHLLEIARTDDPLSTDGGEQWVGKFELVVHRAGQVVWQDPYCILRWEKE